MRHALFVVVCLTFSVNASENLSDHAQFCAPVAAQNCGDYLQQQLTALTPYSSAWYRIKAYQLNYLFDKHQFRQLNTEAEQLLQQPNLPEVLKVQLYFYYAKTLFYFERRDEAKHYAKLALAMLEEVYHAFGDPLRLVELANLHYSLGELEQAGQLLQVAQSRYQKSKDPQFSFELNSNLALVAHQRGDLAAAAAYRSEALTAASALGHHNKIIVAMGNLARTRQLLGQLQEALQLYQDSLQFTAAAEHRVQHQIHLLRLSEISLQLQQPAQARAYLQQVIPEQLGPGHRQLYQQLATALDHTP
ncbi:tetratricopeptide repeat protein [Alishewanella sp. HH-ZS]|uniref:tetratricopeptide repeat protein n=1 Tax=Alishewanella sp. HH-ZS TaxID=1856684 RepID=UPI0008235AA0|nr:tetratricopeptide repeat protein [Alishewanella sp. HH-ZS]OCW95377.1 hypothetical protein A9165_14050 [Alishewanella sp. HH-ZS]